MTKTLNLLFFFFFPSVIFAQITFMQNNTTNKYQHPNAVYDSLTNITTQYYEDKFSYHHLTGQKILFLGYYREGFEKKIFDYGKYYTIDTVKYYDTSKLTYENRKYSSYVFTVIDDETQQKIDVFESDKIKLNYTWVVVGLFEKLKATFKDKCFIYTDKYKNSGFEYLISLETGKPNFNTIDEGTIWKCTDVQVKPYSENDYLNKYDPVYKLNQLKRCPIVLIFENETYGKHYMYYQNKEGHLFVEYYSVPKDYTFETHHLTQEEKENLVCGYFVEKNFYDKILSEEKIAAENKKKEQQAERKKRIAELTPKYGAANAAIIADKQVSIGFTKDMCIESWGKPTSVNKTTTAYSTHEQWVYKFGTGTRYLYFDNNKLTSFQ